MEDKEFEKLNELAVKYIRDINGSVIEDGTLKKLDELAHKNFSDINGLPALELNFSGSTTVIEKDDDAFSLAIGGFVREVRSEVLKNNEAVCRAVISFRGAEMMIQNETRFNYMMSLYINAMLTDLTKNVGSLKERTISLRRPGSFDKYFRDIGNEAGYELRIFTKVKE